MPDPKEKSTQISEKNSPVESSSEEQFDRKINFKFHMNRHDRFSEEFLADILCVSRLRLHKTTTLLCNTGEIMIYGSEDSREFKLEDVYIILTRHKKKHQVNVLEQFKKEFFND
jgi:hypothetical protein